MRSLMESDLKDLPDAKAITATGGVGEELADEVAGEEITTGVSDDLLEAGEVGVGLAEGEFASGV